jgi:hypothetical protein
MWVHMGWVGGLGRDARQRRIGRAPIERAICCLRETLVGLRHAGGAHTAPGMPCGRGMPDP